MSLVVESPGMYLWFKLTDMPFVYRTPCVNKCTKFSCCVLMPKFHYIYLAQNLLKTRFPTSFEQKKSQKPGLRQGRSISTCRDRPSGKFSTNKKSRGPGHRQVLSRKKVGNLVTDKFWAEKSRKPGFRQVLSRKKVGDLVSDFFCGKKSRETWSPTCLRPGLRQVVRQVVRQDRSNGIWA